MPAPDDVVTPGKRAHAAAKQGDTTKATMWALLAIVDDLAQIRRDLHWQIRSGSRHRG